MATRFCSPDSGAGELVSARACASSSLLTGFALRTSGSPDALESAAKALRVSGSPSVGTGEAAGAIVAAAPTLVPPAGRDPLPGATAGVAVGDACAVDTPRPGASRCTLRRNFIPKKPITKTSTPKMSGIGETRLLPPPVEAGRRRTTGAETGFARSFSWRYE